MLIDGDKLICTPGSEHAGTFAALDKATGKVLWRSAEVTAWAEYGSPILIEYIGVRQVVTMSRSGLVAVSPEDGKFLWQHNRMTKKGPSESGTAHGNSPAYVDGYVFKATSYHTRGDSAVALKSTASGVELKTGEERRFGRGPGKGSMICADGMLFCFSDKGLFALIEAQPKQFSEVSAFDLPEGQGPSWTHPVISHRKLYLRWNDKLYVYLLKE